jgi:CubicO group peptidase (beta-lactamase class C family)
MKKIVNTFLFLLCLFLILSLFTGCLSKPESLEEMADKMYSSYNQLENSPSVSVLAAKDGKIIFAKSYGHSNVETGEIATPETSYRLGCITKPFTCMGILILKERGLIDLDQPVKEILTDFPKSAEKVTVRNLMQNASGLPDYQDLWPQDGAYLHDREVYQLVKDHDQNRFPPGTDTSISNDTAFAILALVIEQVSGMTYQDFMKENIFEPLGMKNTVAFVDGYNTVHNRAYGSVWEEDRFVIGDQYAYSPVLGDGGIYSSVQDLYLWEQALTENTLVSEETLKDALKPERGLSDWKGVSFSSGWYFEKFRGHEMIQTSGGTIGFSNMFVRIPEEKVCVIILTNVHNCWRVLKDAKKLAAELI